MDEMSATTVTGKSRTVALPRRPLDWLKVFGPGAIIASLTIGTGELIFSSRGGALFGYRILFLFVVISLLKWGLVVASSRHMVLTGVHPYQRMLDLPGPRGWLTLALFLIAAVCLPIWVSFHSGVLGNLTAWMTGTSEMLGGGIDYLWGAAILAVVVAITALRGYSTLERIQLIIVAAMVFSAGVTLVLYHPDWLGLLKGAVIPQTYVYPHWLSAEYPHIAAKPVWIETTRYVGVIGGAGLAVYVVRPRKRPKHRRQRLGNDQRRGVGRVLGQTGNGRGSGDDVLGETIRAVRQGQHECSFFPVSAAGLDYYTDVFVSGPAHRTRKINVAPETFAGVLAHVASTKGYVAAPHQHLAFDRLGPWNVVQHCYLSRLHYLDCSHR